MQGPPRPTGTPARDVSLTGMLFPWDPRIDNPVLLRVPESPAYYLACFSSASALRTMMALLEIEGYTIKLVQDGREFYESVSVPRKGDPLHVILDPHMTPQGTLRYTQVLGSN